MISNENWSNMYNAIGVNDTLEAFYKVLLYHYNNVFPLKSLKVKNKPKWS